MAKWPLIPQLKHDGSSLAASCPGARAVIVNVEQRVRLRPGMRWGCSGERLTEGKRRLGAVTPRPIAG